MNYDELLELLQYIEKNHSWKNTVLYPEAANPQRTKERKIKYVNFDMDTRDCMIWRVTFRGISNSPDKYFEGGKSLKDKIYKWLRS